MNRQPPKPTLNHDGSIRYCECPPTSGLDHIMIGKLLGASRSVCMKCGKDIKINQAAKPESE